MHIGPGVGCWRASGAAGLPVPGRRNALGALPQPFFRRVSLPISLQLYTLCDEVARVFQRGDSSTGEVGEGYGLYLLRLPD